MESFDLEEFKATEWYKERPEIIKKAIDQTPPNKLYRFKESKKECFIVGYGEPKDPEDMVTLIVQKTGNGGPLAEIGLGILDRNQVFDVTPEDLELVI